MITSVACVHAAAGDPLVPDALTDAGLPAIAGVPGVVCVPHVAFVTAIAGVPAVDNVSAVASVPADTKVSILYGVFMYPTVQ